MAFIRCITSTTQDAAYNAAKSRVLAYYHFIGDQEKALIWNSYYESADHRKWIEDFRPPNVFPEIAVADTARYSGANL